MEKGEPFYDIIISLKTQSDYTMIVDVVDKYLSIKNKIIELERESRGSENARLGNMALKI